MLLFVRHVPVMPIRPDSDILHYYSELGARRDATNIVAVVARIRTSNKQSVTFHLYSACEVLLSNN